MSLKAYKPAKAKLSTERRFFNVPGSNKEYDTVLDLAPYNPLLFRINHKNSGSRYFERQGIVASQYYSIDHDSGKAQLDTSIEEIRRRQRIFDLELIPDDRLVEHVLYNKDVRMRFVSATFSFTWALFFAEMNMTNWNEEDVELFIIDTRSVANHAYVSHERLSRVCPNWYNNTKHRKVMNAAYSSQEVIVLDCIPESAIISRVRWTDLRQKLPSWFYRPSGYLSAKELIPIPNDNGWQRYVRWQKAIQERLHQLSVVSWVRWELLSRREVVDFVFAVFSFQDYMGTNDLKPSLSGMDISRNFEELSKHAAKSLLTWSRGFSSILLETEDDNEFTRLIQVSISTSPQDTMHSITKSFYIQSLG